MVRDVLGFQADIVTVPWLTPDGDVQQVLKKLDSDDDVLLVSHQPLVGNLISFCSMGISVSHS